MSGLADFITARLDEDEAAARESHHEGQRWITEEEGVYRWPDDELVHSADRKADARHIARHDPARVLREVTAKRAMVAMCREDLAAQYEPGDGEWNEGSIHASKAWANTVLRTMAAIWADHPDYPSPAAL